MYELTINDKLVTVEVVQEGAMWVFASECGGQHFHSAMSLRDGIRYLLVKKSIVGVGMYSGDQETLKAMHEEYEEKAHGVRTDTDTDSTATA